MEPKVIDYSSAFLKLNLSGKRYKILKSTCLRLYNSLFAELANLDEKGNIGRMQNLKLSPGAASTFYMIDTNEFYLERSATVFDLVLHYVYTSRLHCPAGVCKEMLLEELEFWRVVRDDNRLESKIAQCCQQQREPIIVVDSTTEQEEGKKNEEHEDGRKSVTVVEPVKEGIKEEPKTFLAKVWMCCEDPASSKIASLLNIVSIFFILLSIVNLVLSTVKSLHHCTAPKTGDDIILSADSNVTEIGLKTDKPKCEGGPIFDLIEAICIGWFTLELIARFIACPDKCRFFKSTFNIIDILATVPFYIELILKASNFSTGKLLMIYAFRLLRILRIMRALRLARYFDSVRIMGETFKKCRKDFGVLLVFICMAMIIASSVVYYFERDEVNTQFTSIPAAFWWCIVTLTTVGYGDMYPTTSGGRVCTGVVCVLGVIVMAMPISIMVEQFGQTYKTRVVKHKHADVRALFKMSVRSKRTSSVGQVKPIKNEEVKHRGEDALLIYAPKKREVA